MPCCVNGELREASQRIISDGVEGSVCERGRSGVWGGYAGHLVSFSPPRCGVITVRRVEMCVFVFVGGHVQHVTHQDDT